MNLARFGSIRSQATPHDHDAMRTRGVRFLEEPRHETYGTVAVFEDLYGNRWDLLELHEG